MDKREALEIIFELDGILDRLIDYNKNVIKRIEVTILLDLLSKDSFNMKELAISAPTVARFISKVFPGKPKTTEKVDSFLFAKFGLKHCTKCHTVKTIEEFNTNPSNKRGLNTYCKTCHSSTNAETQTGRTSKYRAAKLHRTVSWANQEKIKEIYDNCPEGYHVDHIIPLQGKYVSGLHVEGNLQYLTAKENLSKSNK